MLTAVSPKDNKLPAYEITKSDKAREIEWCCPLCEEEVYYVSEGSDGTISHFKHYNEADHPRISEGKVHNKAKRKIYKKLKRDNQRAKIELEKKIKSLTPANKDRITDIFLKHPEEGKIAVEIQCSNQTLTEFMQRSLSYTKNNISVLWLLNAKKYAYEKSTSADPKADTIVYKDSVEWLQKNLYYGRVYVFDPGNFTPTPIRLRSKKIHRQSSPNWPPKTEYLSTIADFSQGKIPSYSLNTKTGSGFKVAGFYDKCWWKNND